MWVRGYAEQVVIGCRAKIIARHQRSYEGEDNVFDPLHYLPLIERNIGALDQAAALAGAAPPLRLRTGTVFRVHAPSIIASGHGGGPRSDSGKPPRHEGDGETA